jgi:hypothetical protein
MTAFYVGNNPDTLIEQLGESRYYYGIRRDEDGYLYLYKIDQLAGADDVIQVNKIGDDPSKDFTDFEFGVDFFDGRLEDHEIDPDIANIVWEQYRWDSRNIFYYINSEGEFVVRINQPYDYPPALS